MSGTTQTTKTTQNEEEGEEEEKSTTSDLDETHGVYRGNTGLFSSVFVFFKKSLFSELLSVKVDRFNKELTTADLQGGHSIEDLRVRYPPCNPFFFLNTQKNLLGSQKKKIWELYMLIHLSFDTFPKNYTSKKHDHKKYSVPS